MTAADRRRENSDGGTSTCNQTPFDDDGDNTSYNQCRLAHARFSRKRDVIISNGHVGDKGNLFDDRVYVCVCVRAQSSFKANFIVANGYCVYRPNRYEKYRLQSETSWHTTRSLIAKHHSALSLIITESDGTHAREFKHRDRYSFTNKLQNVCKPDDCSFGRKIMNKVADRSTIRRPPSRQGRRWNRQKNINRMKTGVARKI